MTQRLIGLDPQFAEHATAVRKAYGRLTPYRLGMEVAKAGHDYSNPYEPRTKSARLYAEGLVAGREMRRRRLERERDAQAR